MVTETLRAMALGGMRDHVGGGFHRYSVDAEWRVPHFEKMLYDQAQLVLAYLEAAQATGEDFYATVAEDTLDYVLRDMTDAGGGFYSAEDADSVPPEQAGQPGAHKSEGAFYIWTDEEIGTLLGERRIRCFAGGSASSRTATRRTIRRGSSAARTCSTSRSRSKTSRHEPAAARRGDGRARACAAGAVRRSQRTAAPAPGRQGPDRVERPDDRRLRPRRARAAARTGRGALSRRRAAGRRLHARARCGEPESGRLLRRYRDGDAAIDGYAEDYAYLIFGLLELFQADGDPAWLEWAVTLQQQQDALFWDEPQGGWFSTTGRDPTVLLRLKEDYDGAEPAPSSVSVLNLLTMNSLGRLRRREGRADAGAVRPRIGARRG